ncbi:MAG: TatD family hydrolase, partial [Actinomycetota bacterium]
DSIDAALDALQRWGPPSRLVFHCWSGERVQLDSALGLGAFVSFAGNVTFKSAGALREIVPLVPDGRLLVETDSPYLAPVPQRGRPNEPAFLPRVGEAVAAARDDSVEEIARLTTRNARELFGLDGG